MSSIRTIREERVEQSSGSWLGKLLGMIWKRRPRSEPKKLGVLSEIRKEKTMKALVWMIALTGWLMLSASMCEEQRTPGWTVINGAVHCQEFYGGKFHPPDIAEVDPRYETCRAQPTPGFIDEQPEPQP